MGKLATRLYIEEDLAAGTVVGVDHQQAHYLRSVLRLSRGAAIALFNGRDGEWLAELEGLGKGWASLAVQRRIREQDESPDVWLVFAPIKRARIDFLAEKATELGCRRLLPVMTRFTAMDRVNVERLRANAREAAEQCERLDVPQVEPPQPLTKLLDAWPADRRLFVCCERDAAPSLGDALAAATEPQPAAVMTGPEGGFAESELATMARLPFVTLVGLGPRILRSDTAALAALAIWQSVRGDGSARPSSPASAQGESEPDLAD